MKIEIDDKVQFKRLRARDYQVGKVVVSQSGRLFLIVNYEDEDLNVDNLYCNLETGVIYNSEVPLYTKIIDVKVVDDD